MSHRSLIILLIILLVCCFLINMSLGSVMMPFMALTNFLTTASTGVDTWDMILKGFRLPKAIVAMLVGSGLGICGLQMQTLFRNPLAGPYVLGISSAAGLGVALVIFLGLKMGWVFELTQLNRSWLTVLAAGAGAFLLLLLMLMLLQNMHDSVTLLLLGLMLGTTASAIVGLMQYFSQGENIKAYVMWSFGSLGSLSWSELSVFIPIVLIGLMMSVFLSKPLNALLLGESYARSLGLNITKIRILIVLNTSILAGAITAFCGPIAFLGIALPHIARMLFSTTDHLRLTPLIILLGAIIMLLFDAIAQMPGTDIVLPINAVTSLFGAPFVIYLLLRNKTKKMYL